MGWKCLEGKEDRVSFLSVRGDPWPLMWISATATGETSPSQVRPREEACPLSSCESRAATFPLRESQAVGCLLALLPVPELRSACPRTP